MYSMASTAIFGATTSGSIGPSRGIVLVNSGKLADHLKGVERMAEQRMDTLLPQLMKAAGVTEELKARDQMAWVGLVNNCRARADEIILADLVYV